MEPTKQPYGSTSSAPPGVSPPTSVQAAGPASYPPPPQYGAHTAAGQLAAASASEPIRVVLEDNAATSLIYRLAFWGGWIGFAVCFFALIGMSASLASYFDTTGGISEKFYLGSKTATDKIAMITISGVIGEGEGYVKKQIDRIAADDEVKAIVVRVDSPGGTITGSDYILHHLKELKKKKNVPLVVSMGSIAASGGYYVSMAVGDQPDSIYAEPTTTTGSIGVIIPHYDLTDLMEQYKVKDDSFKSHPNKAMLSMTEKMSPEQRALIQGYLMEAFGRFKNVVKEGRPGFAKDPTALDDLATGEIFSADRAKKLGLVDKLGFIEDATARAAELANLSEGKYRVIRYEKPTSLMELSPFAAGKAHASPLEGIMELATPKAYYLCTTLPIWMRAE
jgi:protease-4